jgi:hypothetical protein
MPYFIVFTGRDQRTIKNKVTSNHPSEWFANTKTRIKDSGSTEQITLLWWCEVTDEQAELFDPGYHEIPGMEYDPITAGRKYSSRFKGIKTINENYVQRTRSARIARKIR